MSDKVESPTVQEVPEDAPVLHRVVDWTPEEEKKAKRKQVQLCTVQREQSTNNPPDLT